MRYSKIVILLSCFGLIALSLFQNCAAKKTYSQDPRYLNSGLNPLCDAGETYDGTSCVPFKAECDSFVELKASPYIIPARSSENICYFIKVVNAVASASSSTIPAMRSDIIARSHDANTPNPRIMGETKITNLLIGGEREMILASNSIGTGIIKVDNFVLVESYFDDNDGSSTRRLFGQGTADAPRTNEPLSVGGHEVKYITGKNGGTDIINPIDLQAFIPILRPVQARISALDCGGTAEASDIYLVFK